MKDGTEQQVGSPHKFDKLEQLVRAESSLETKQTRTREELKLIESFPDSATAKLKTTEINLLLASRLSSTI